MISETFTQKVRRQIALEHESRALGAERYRSARPLPWRDEPSSAEQEGDLPPGRQLVRLAIEPTAEAFADFKDRALNGAAVSVDAADILCSIGDEEAAALTARVVMHAAAEGMMLTATALRVADAMIDHIQLLSVRQRSVKALKTHLLKQGRKSQTKRRRRNLRGFYERMGADRTFTMKQRLRAGVKAIELFCDATGLFVIDTTGFGKRRIRPTESVHRWLEQQHARCELLSPIHLPMIVEPRRWVSPHKGGYITKFPGQRLVKQANRNYHEQLRDVDMPDVYDAVNAVQSTPWRINARVYEVVREIWDDGGLLGGLPERNPQPVPARPVDADEETLARWKREAMNIYDANNKQVAQRIWATADNPFLALAACFEWLGYVENGGDWITHLPVHLDGSNSGLQHFSALLRDPVGGAAVNLVPQERPADIYSDVAKLAQAKADHAEDAASLLWADGKVTRKIAKRPTMTYTYSATRFGMVDQIYQTLREIDRDGAHIDGDNYAASFAMSYILWDSIQETVIAASAAMDWLRQAARVMTKAGKPIWWTTPAGLPVLQDYPNTRRDMIRVYHQSKELRLIVHLDDKGIDGRRQANAIAPNYIHSMDAISEQLEGVNSQLTFVRTALQGVQLGAQLVAEKTAEAVASETAKETPATSEV